MPKFDLDKIVFVDDSGDPYTVRLYQNIIEKLLNERKEIQEKERTLTCVFCGKIYEPGTPTSNHESLTEHISVCPNHPMSALKKKYNAIINALKDLNYIWPRVRLVDAFRLDLLDVLPKEVFEDIYGEIKD